MSNEINSGDDVIDSRDVISRIEELENDIINLEEDIDALEDEAESLEDDETENSERNEQIETEINGLKSDLEDIQDELNPLATFAEQGENYAADWNHGTTLINVDYFETYAKELHEDINESNDNWPYNCIDWTVAADELKVDYSEIDFNGESYLVR